MAWKNTSIVSITGKHLIKGNSKRVKKRYEMVGKSQVSRLRIQDITYLTLFELKGLELSTFSKGGGEEFSV